MSDAQLRGRVSSGHLLRVGAHTYRSPSVPPSLLGDLTALTLDIGPPCWISGPSAAALHNFDGYHLHAPFHITVPREHRVRRERAVIHTSDSIGALDRADIDGLPVLSSTRTIIDLARTESRQRLTAALDSALRDRTTSEDFLHRRIVELRSSGRYGIPKLLDVIEGSEASRGGHSWLERTFLELLARHRLPRPTTQVVIARTSGRPVRVDCHFAQHHLVVELLGYRWHRSKQQMEHDADRANALLLRGERLLQFTYEHVVSRPGDVVKTLARALWQHP